MICHEFLPNPRLRTFVESYQLRHFIFPAGSTIPFKPYAPRPEHTLAFFPRGKERVEHLANNTFLTRPRSVIIGQSSERTNRHLIGPEFCVLLVNFRPGVLYRMMKLPFSEFTNTFVDAEDILPKEIKRVNERLSSACSASEMIAIVDRFICPTTRFEYKCDIDFPLV